MHSNLDTKAPPTEFPMRFDPASIERPHLVTFVFSHYCELARWALEDANVDFVEVPYALGCHTGPLAKLRANRAHRSESAYAGMESGVHAGRRKYAVPLVVFPDGRILRDSWEVLDSYVGPVNDSWRTRFDNGLGPAARQVFYSAVLDPEHPALLASLSQNATPLEQGAWARMGPMIMENVRTVLKINETSAAEARAHIESLFDEADAFLAPFGPGAEEEPSLRAWWLALCSLSSIALLAPEYCDGMWTPPAMDMLPPEFVDWVSRMREMPLGRRILAFYARERRTKSG